MMIERTDTGYIRISDIIDGQYYSHLYMDYTLKEAKILFKQYVGEERGIKPKNA